MDKIEEKSVGEIVAGDYRAARVFEAHKIDFCCNGGRGIQEAAKEKDLDWHALVEEINKAIEGRPEEQPDFRSMPLDALADYIVKTHHQYAERQIGVVRPYLEKICQVHGKNHPELFRIKDIFYKISGVIITHQKKEEIMLFPFIKRLVKVHENREAFKNNTSATVKGPVSMLTDEHEEQGAAFRKIAGLSNDYTPPEDACNTYVATLNLLQDFERDLHKHIHLENNILFPKALELERLLNHHGAV